MSHEGAKPRDRSASRRMLSAFAAAVPVVVIFLAVLSILLAAAGPDGLALSDSETAAWIVVLYGLPALPTLALTLRYRTPLMLTGNVFAVIFFASLGDRFEFRELCGAALIAGAVVALISALRLTGRLAAWVPAPIVHGLIAGAVMPFVAGIFTRMSTGGGGGVAAQASAPIMIGSALGAFLVHQRFLGARVPPVLSALLAGIAAAAVTGQLGHAPTSFALPELTVGWPELSVEALAAATPVLVALVVVQSNLPSLVYIQGQGYRPSERAINLASGVTSMVGSFVGPSAVALALPLVPLTAGPAAGERSIRYRSVYIPVAALLLISLLARADAEVAVLVPPSLLLAIAGLALLAVLLSSLREVTRGPLTVGPVFAFVIALSDIDLIGLGPFFWSLVLGIAISLLLERDAWNELRTPTEREASPSLDR